MSKTKRLNNLKELLQNELEGNYFNLNSGGCGIIAYLLAKELCKAGFKAEIVWLSYSKMNTINFDNALNNNKKLTLLELNKFGVVCCHCFVKVNGKLVDSTGVYKTLKETRWSPYVIIKKLNWKTLEPIVLSPEGWNTMFQRNQIPQIKKSIKKIVKNLVN